MLFDQPLFELSVGLLPYPLTFLITDLISEIYGKRRANLIVIAGIFASFFSAGILFLGDILPAVEYSPINDALYKKVFSLSPIAALASMIAYLIAQFVDIRIYHFWKKLTKGKKLWLRNNFSTFASQFLDSVTVVGLLCLFNILSWENFLGLSMASFIFKILVALIDTPFLYLFVYVFRKRFSLKIGEEIDWNRA
tara:strand:- start:185 stop:769 length:585 start_codon:yes stop_codon:yes gene_type:complete